MDTKKISLSHDEVAMLLDALHHLQAQRPAVKADICRNYKLTQKLQAASEEMTSNEKIYEYDLVRRDTGTRFLEPVQNAKEAVRFLMLHCFESAQCWREKVVLVFLSAACRATGWFTLGLGGSQTCAFDLRAAVTATLEAGASHILLAHNHPSGNPRPSQADIRQTEDLKHALAAFDIQITDHIILGADKAYSFTEEQEFNI